MNDDLIRRALLIGDLVEGNFENSFILHLSNEKMLYIMPEFD